MGQTLSPSIASTQLECTFVSPHSSLLKSDFVLFYPSLDVLPGTHIDEIIMFAMRIIYGDAGYSA